MFQLIRRFVPGLKTGADGSSLPGETEGADDDFARLRIAYRLCYRPFIDANGWRTIEEYDASDDPWGDDGPPITRRDFERTYRASASPGHYKLFPISNDKRLMPAVWGTEFGTRETAKRLQNLASDQGAASDDPASDDGERVGLSTADFMQLYLNAQQLGPGENDLLEEQTRVEGFWEQMAASASEERGTVTPESRAVAEDVADVLDPSE